MDVPTMGGGIWKFDKKTGRFKVYKNVPGVDGSLSHNNVIQIMFQQK